MPARMRPSRGNRSKHKTVLLGGVEPSRTLSPTSTKIGSPMLPIIERFGSGPTAHDHNGGLYHGLVLAVQDQESRPTKVGRRRIGTIGSERYWPLRGGRRGILR